MIKNNVKTGIATKDMALIAMLTAVTCVLAPLSIQIGLVPISLTNFVIYFGLFILGVKKEAISYLVYLIIGLVGVPVFSGFTGGPGKLIGPTGGYLIGFLPMLIIAGIVIEKWGQKRLVCILGMILGTAVCYIFGTAWLAWQGEMDFKTALFAGVIPFIPGDLLKMLIATFVGPSVQKRLRTTL